MKAARTGTPQCNGTKMVLETPSAVSHATQVGVRMTDTQLRLLHQACIVKKLSDCHDSIPTGYELIWTWNNTTVFSVEKPSHSHFSCLASELLTLNAKVEALFFQDCPGIQNIFLRKWFKAEFCVRVEDLSVFSVIWKINECSDKEVNSSGETSTRMLKEQS